jgi:ABC-type enterochelin transport system substrate-binding protein
MKNKILLSLAMMLVTAFLLSACLPTSQNGAQSTLDETVQSPADKTTAETDETANMQPPRQVVDAYLKTTLGTIPSAQLDYDKAKTLMTKSYVQEFTDASFVPLSYGIQQGPDKVEFEREDISGSQAEVIIMGYWGDDLQMRWKFELLKEDGSWKIDLINPGQ